MVAQPRKLEGNEGDELITIESFKKVLRCAICYDTLKDPYTVRTCLHMYCN